MSTQNARGGAAGKGAVTWAIVVTSLACFMAGLDNLVIVTALPTIRNDLGGGLQDLEWTVNAYTLSFAVLMMLASAIGDRIGRRKTFVAGLVIFSVASAAAALAPSIGTLIAARAFQGLGAAVIMPLTITLLTAAVPAEKRGAAFGIMGAINGLALAGGPLVGGFIVEALSWHWIFWLNVPVGLILAPLAWRKMNESRGADVRLDVMGTVLVSLALFGLVLGVIRGNVDGWTAPDVLISLIGGAVLLLAFVLWENHSDHPMLPMAMFRSRAFTGVNLSGVLMGIGVYGVIFLLTQFMQTAQGYTPLQAGLRMLAWTALPIVVAPLAGMISDKIGGKVVVIVGLILMGVAFAYWAVIITPTVSYAAQLPAFLLAGAGIAMFYAPLTNVLMSSVEPHAVGIASGSSAATRELGAAVGIAALSTVFTSFGGGYGSAQQFVGGMVPALWVGAVMVALAAIAMAIVPRRAQAGPGTDTPAAVQDPAESAALVQEAGAI
jgi:EmrB/QacA subfamily drug resistance transporter